jgi:hypothetical protein
MKKGDTIAVIANFGSGDFYRQYFFYMQPSESKVIWVSQKVWSPNTDIYYREIKHIQYCKKLLYEKIIIIK